MAAHRKAICVKTQMRPTARTVERNGKTVPVQVNKAAALRPDRLTIAQAAQFAAIARHARKPMPASVPTDPDDDRHVDRSEAQDLHAWNE